MKKQKLLSFLFLLCIFCYSVFPLPASHADSDTGFTNLGGQIKGITIYESAFGKDKKGNDVVFAVVTGEPAQLAVVDLKTRKLLKLLPLESATGAWAITVATDGKVWVGSYRNGHVYCYDPKTEELKDLGRSSADSDVLFGLSSGPDGSVYGGSYGKAKIFGYTKDGKPLSFDSVSPGDTYAQDTVYNPDKKALYIGIGSSKAKVIQMDINTKATKQILPSKYQTQSEAYDLNYISGKLFVKLHSAFQTIVLNPETEEVDTLTDLTTKQKTDSFPSDSRGVSPLAPDGHSVYYSNKGFLLRYDIKSKSYAPVVDNKKKPIDLQKNPVIGWTWVEFKEKNYPGKTLVGLAGNYEGKAFRYNPQTHVFEYFQLPFPPQPIDLFNVIADSKDKIYTNAYLNGRISSYQAQHNIVKEIGRLGQVEGWTWFKGKLYAGTYPDGKLLVYDPNKPWKDEENPKLLFKLRQGYEQNRPLAVITDQTNIYMGTTPDYGKYGGALTVVNPNKPETPVVYRNIVTDQSIASLTTFRGKIWGGTSIEGGGGTKPKATEAKLFCFDPKTKQKVGEYSPLLLKTVKKITALTIGEDGNIWGIADGYIFAFNPLLKIPVFQQQVVENGIGQGAGIQMHPNHHLYAVTDGLLFSINPLLKYVRYIPYSAGLYRLTIQGNSLYMKDGTAVTTGKNLIRYLPDDSHSIKIEIPIKSKVKYRFNDF
ncbi:PQQ-binding-like beta-propeller repeat protein [Shimazuella sp. AN120528]|uniref:PQQ-binding-like beta-propeller repeat protein n=1 Tax=Shimazuella soli TaxID=1892854 RepID=UPI001F0EB540|nr:PQQ-binding-like beta-propeller repeat protein [Shimazuella soli]MCH5583702.1 PQQ-binding-like beta-propeller repeat protein [Shimazuella soli]